MGTQRCQLCGELGLFTGFCLAVATHPRVLGRYEYINVDCINKAAGGRAALGVIDSQWAAQLLAAQPYRFCEICNARVVLLETSRRTLPNGFEIWCCQSCRQKPVERNSEK